MDELKAKHDALLLQGIPENANHDADTCVFCNNEFSSENDEPAERGDMKNYTEDEFNAAVSAALAPIQAELEQLKAARAEDEVNVLVAQAKEEAAASIAEIESARDLALAEVANSKQELADVKAFLEATAAEAEEAQLIESRKVTRRAEIAKVASFSEEVLDEHMDRWAAKSDEEFSDLMTGWAAIKPEASGEIKEISEIPETSMSSTRTPAPKTSVTKSYFSDLLDAGDNGVNIRTI